MTAVRFYRAGIASATTRIRIYRAGIGSVGAAPIISVSPVTATVEAGAEVDLVATEVDDGVIVTRQWVHDATVIGTSPSITVTVPVSAVQTTQTYTYTATDDDGQSSSATATLTVRKAIITRKESDGSFTGFVIRDHVAGGNPGDPTDMPGDDLAGWSLVARNDFTAFHPVGAFVPDPSTQEIASTAAAYADYFTVIKFSTEGQPDTYNVAKYYASKTISTKAAAGANGVLDIFVHSETLGGVSTPIGAWVRPLRPDGDFEHAYGRYSIRMRADPAPGYGFVQLLIAHLAANWPDWGELDWPEGDLAAKIVGWYHRANPDQAAKFQVTPTPDQFFAQWHIFTIEWTPGNVKWLIDTTKVLDTTLETPANPLKFLWQVGGSSGSSPPAPAVTGHIQIDWFAMWDYDFSPFWDVVADEVGDTF